MHIQEQAFGVTSSGQRLDLKISLCLSPRTRREVLTGLEVIPCPRKEDCVSKIDHGREMGFQQGLAIGTRDLCYSHDSMLLCALHFETNLFDFLNLSIRVYS